MSTTCEFLPYKDKNYETQANALYPGRLTWNLQITHLERKMIFQTSMIMFHVSLPGCISLVSVRNSDSCLVQKGKSAI